VVEKSPVNEVTHAGCLRKYIKEWKKITSDKYILNAVVGFEIPFVEIPKQVSEPQCISMSEADILALDGCIVQLLKSKAIEKVSSEDGQFISTVFVVPKPDGSSRPVINLKRLNEYVDCPHFKMENFRRAMSILSRNCFMSVIDVKDAYHMIPIAKKDRKFLRFRWKGVLYEYTCLPFGLNIAPRLYTKLMKPLLAKLRSLGYKSVSY
jgi:hypothetical protein